MKIFDRLSDLNVFKLQVCQLSLCWSIDKGEFGLSPFWLK